MISSHAFSHMHTENVLKGPAEAISMSKIIDETSADK